MIGEHLRITLKSASNRDMLFFTPFLTHASTAVDNCRLWLIHRWNSDFFGGGTWELGRGQAVLYDQVVKTLCNIGLTSFLVRKWAKMVKNGLGEVAPGGCGSRAFFSVCSWCRWYSLINHWHCCGVCTTPKNTCQLSNTIELWQFAVWNCSAAAHGRCTANARSRHVWLRDSLKRS